MKEGIIFIAAAAMLALTACCTQPGKTEGSCNDRKGPSWQERLQEMLPLLGHRNWIVIADMAYPLQSGQGITTLYADEPYQDVLKATLGMINEAPHVFAHVYHDKELGFLTEDMVKGIDGLRASIMDICGPEAQSIMHEDLIKRLDEAGHLYNVVIIKTPLTVPYTTTFFELDCAYWGPEKQGELDKVIK